MVEDDVRAKDLQDGVSAVVALGKLQVAAEDVGVDLDAFGVGNLARLARVLQDDRGVALVVVDVRKALVHRPPSEQVGDRQCDVDAAVALAVPPADDVDRVRDRVLVGEGAIDPLTVLVVAPRPGRRNVGDERVRRADAEHRAQADLRDRVEVPVGVDRIVGARRRGAEDRDAGRRAEADALQGREHRLRIPPVRGRGVPVDLVGWPAEFRPKDPLDHAVPGVGVAVDQTGHNHPAGRVHGADRLVAALDLLPRPHGDDPVSR